MKQRLLIVALIVIVLILSILIWAGFVLVISWLLGIDSNYVAITICFLPIGYISIKYVITGK